jgi:hypothetical protein
MGVRTSVYLSGDLAAAVKAAGVPLAELVRRGLEARSPEEAAAELAAGRAVESVRPWLLEDFAVAAARAVSGAHDDLFAELGAVVRDEVRSALRDLQGGGL